MGLLGLDACIMRIRNLTGKGQNIGHGPNNPGAYLTDEQVVALIQQAYDEGYRGVRWNWAFDSMCPAPTTCDTRRLLFIVEQLASRGMLAWPVHGAGPYPNQARWKRLTEIEDWHGCLTPTTLWRPVVSLINAALRQVWDWLTANGYDPRQLLAWQCGNEHGDGGVGDPTRTDLTRTKNGTGVLLPEMAAWLEFLALNVNTLGMPMVSPGMELQAASAAAEVADLLSYPWMRRFDIIDVHIYDDTPGTAADKLRSVLGWMGMRDEYIGGRPVWVGETGNNTENPRQACNALLEVGVDAVGWLG